MNASTMHLPRHLLTLDGLPFDALDALLTRAQAFADGHYDRRALDGVAVCSQLRSRELRTPIIMLTARDAVGDRILGLDAGADDYLVKPFALSELLARMRAPMRRATERTSDTLQVGELRLDPSTDYVLVRKRKIPLTAREFALLQYFMKNPERVLEVDRITRISYLVGIYKALYILYGDKLADEWVQLPNTNAIFGGRTPLDYMMAGGLLAMQTVRKLLDARRGGA